MLKEFKNGNLVVDVRRDIKEGYFDINDTEWIDQFYYHELTMEDYYFYDIEGSMYLVNYRTENIYDFSNCCINVLIFLKEQLEEGNYKCKLYPMDRKTTKELFKALERQLESE